MREFERPLSIEPSGSERDRVSPETTDLPLEKAPDWLESREKTQQVEQKERQLMETIGQYLAREDNPTQEPDDPRLALREQVIAYELVPAFLQDQDGRHHGLETLEDYEARLTELTQQFIYTYNNASEDRRGLTNVPGHTNAELLDLIAILGQRPNVYRPETPGVLHFTVKDEAGRVTNPDEHHATATFLDRHPHFRHKLAVLQAAAREVGEEPLFHPTLLSEDEPIAPDDRDQAVTHFHAMHEARRRELARDEAELVLLGQVEALRHQQQALRETHDAVFHSVHQTEQQLAENNRALEELNQELASTRSINWTRQAALRHKQHGLEQMNKQLMHEQQKNHSFLHRHTVITQALDSLYEKLGMSRTSDLAIQRQMILRSRDTLRARLPENKS